MHMEGSRRGGGGCRALWGRGEEGGEDADVQCRGEGRRDGRSTTSFCLGRTGADP